MTGVELADGRVIARTAVFIRPGNVPQPDGLLTGLGCELDEAGFVSVDGTGQTSTFGVWAAGNVVDPRAQVIASAGAGNAAAIAINADLIQEDVHRAVDDHHTGGVFSAAMEGRLTQTVLGDRRHGCQERPHPRLRCLLAGHLTRRAHQGAAPPDQGVRTCPPNPRPHGPHRFLRRPSISWR